MTIELLILDIFLKNFFLLKLKIKLLFFFKRHFLLKTKLFMFLNLLFYLFLSRLEVNFIFLEIKYFFRNSFSNPLVSDLGIKKKINF